MAKTKYDFIKELLENKKISQNQKDKILELASREISLEGTLEGRIQKIENIIFNENVLPIENPPMSHNLPEYVDPINLYNALLAYNQDSILKTTCHPISNANLEIIISQSEGDKYVLEEHCKLIRSHFENLAKREKFTKKMYALINNYLNGSGSWSSQNIKYSWSYKGLKDWANINQNIVPNPEDSLIEILGNEGYRLENPFISKLTNQTIENFNDLVLYFKSLWHIKIDNPLQRILEKRNVDYNYGEWASFKFINFSLTINLFTDVDKLVQAYSKIIDLIKENSIPNQSIVLSYYEESSRKILSIHQLNTFWKKSISDTIERPFGNSMIPIIENQINGLCDLHIIAKFEDKKSYKVNLWDGKERTADPISDFDGVKYLLILKK